MSVSEHWQSLWRDQQLLLEYHQEKEVQVQPEDEKIPWWCLSIIEPTLAYLQKVFNLGKAISFVVATKAGICLTSLAILNIY